MSSWWPSFSPNPADQAVLNIVNRHPEHRSYVEPRSSSYSATFGKVAAGIGAAEGITRVYDSTMAQQAMQGVGNMIPEGVKATATSAKETVQETAGSIFSTIGDYFGYAKSAYSWTAWGFSWLPGSLKIVVLGAGAIGAYQFYNWVRYPQGYAGSNTLHNNVHVNVNMPQIPDNCRPVVDTTTLANGDKHVQVGLQCEPANKRAANINKLATAMRYEQQFQELAQCKLTRKDKQDIAQMLKRLHDQPLEVKTIRDADALLKEKVQQVKEYHQKLKNAKGVELPEALKNSIEKLCDRFDELEKTEYVDSHSSGLCSDAKALLARVDEQVKLKDFQTRITYIVTNQLQFIREDDLLVEDVKKWKERLDKGIAQKNLGSSLKQVDQTVRLANKRIETYLGGMVISKLRNNRM